jgi:DNA polymerase-3 subunit delta'
MFDELFEEEGEFSTTPAVATVEAGLRPPRESASVIGMEEHERTLLSLYNQGSLPHALIFAGPAGIGKSTMAFRIARFLLKHGAGGDDQDSLFGDAPPPPANMDVADDDPVFRKVASGGHPDLRTVERPIDEKTGVRKAAADVDSVREIAPFLRKTTAEGGWRIVIVDDADTMTRQAQNAILKILEEPPQCALLILICNRLGAMLPTIKSRCRTFHFFPLPQAELMGLLRRGAPDQSDYELAQVAALSDGSAGRAMMFLEEGGTNGLRAVIDFLEGWPDFDWAAIHPWAENLSRKDSEGAYNVFQSSFEWVAAALLRTKAAGADLPEILKDKKLQPLLNHYSLEQWTDICEKLKDHFMSIQNSNLDKRHGVIGAFAILGGQKR